MIARASHEAEALGDSRVGVRREKPLRREAASQSREAGNSVLVKTEQSSLRGKPFSLKQTFAAIWASGIVPPSIIDSEFLERLK